MYFAQPDFVAQESRFADQKTETGIFNGATDYISNYLQML
jgi:hypothetical protein